MLGIALGWGYTFVLTKDLLLEITPLYFIGTRFLLAALLIAVFKWKEIKKISKHVWMLGLGCGLSLWAAFTLQVYAIDLTTPGKAGVLTGATVVLVPFLYYLLYRVPIKWGPILGIALTFGGLCLISWGGSFTGINFGDLLALLGALCFALHIVFVDRVYEKKVAFDQLSFVMIQLFVVGAISCLLAFGKEPLPTNLSTYGWFAYSFDLLIGTLLAYIVQITAQQYTHPSHVGLFLALESMFAFAFSWLLWGEPITFPIIAGIIIILLGIFVTEIYDVIRSAREAKEGTAESSSKTII